ncbi:unnamed protein product [Moneuplotes crassus]|uniref:Uncharacterized protein n=1 Tax=Euplotes crassus TaxID=5936 RepID=A0AAD1UES2_EUPCR|nr:unnamed protein product [Moneuplotes crassus]
MESRRKGTAIIGYHIENSPAYKPSPFKKKKLDVGKATRNAPKNKRSKGRQPKQFFEQDDTSEDCKPSRVPDFAANENSSVFKRDRKGIPRFRQHERPCYSNVYEEDLSCMKIISQPSIGRKAATPQQRSSRLMVDKRSQNCEESIAKARVAHKFQSCDKKEKVKKNLKIRIEDNFKNLNTSKRLTTEVMKFDKKYMKNAFKSETKNHSQFLVAETNQNNQKDGVLYQSNDSKNLLGFRNNRHLMSHSIVNSPMPQSKVGSVSNSKLSYNKNQSEQEENKFEAFFGKERERVWKNALQCNNINEHSHKKSSQTGHEYPQNPFLHTIKALESESSKNTPGFHKKSSNIFMFK